MFIARCCPEQKGAFVSSNTMWSVYFQVEARLGKVEVPVDGVAGVTGSVVEFFARQFPRQSRKRRHVLQQRQILLGVSRFRKILVRTGKKRVDILTRHIRVKIYLATKSEENSLGRYANAFEVQNISKVL